MENSLVKFYTCEAISFNALEEKDKNALYFVTDTRTIYKGETPFGGGSFEVVKTYPTKGKVNTLYLNTEEGSAQFWNGTNFVTVVPSILKNIDTSEALKNKQSLPTAQAIIDYVAGEVAKIDKAGVTQELAEHKKSIDSNTQNIEKVEQESKEKLEKAANDLTALINKKADKGTTLAAYGITDAVTASKGAEIERKADKNAAALSVLQGDGEGSITKEISDALTLQLAEIMGEGKVDESFDTLKEIADWILKHEDTSDMASYFNKVKKNQEDIAKLDTYVGELDEKTIAAGIENVVDSIPYQIAENHKLVVKPYVAEAISNLDAQTQKKITELLKSINTRIDSIVSEDLPNLAAAVAKANAYTDKEIAEKAATKAQGQKADTALQKEDIKEGLSNGTIQVSDTEIKVHGLNTMAYESSANYYTQSEARKNMEEITQNAINNALSWKML